MESGVNRIHCSVIAEPTSATATQPAAIAAPRSASFMRQRLRTSWMMSTSSDGSSGYCVMKPSRHSAKDDWRAASRPRAAALPPPADTTTTAAPAPALRRSAGRCPGRRAAPGARPATAAASSRGSSGARSDSLEIDVARERRRRIGGGALRAHVVEPLLAELERAVLGFNRDAGAGGGDGDRAAAATATPPSPRPCAAPG